MNKEQAIEAFTNNGFSQNPVQFVAEELDIGNPDTKNVYYGFLTIEANPVDAYDKGQLYLNLKGNLNNMMTCDAATTYFLSNQKLVFFDSYSYNGGSNVSCFFTGYKMRK